MGIDMKRVLLGGAAAGAAIALSACAMVPAVGDEMGRALARFDLPPLTWASMAFFAVNSLATGLALAWLYAVALPRLGGGARTAIIVAGVVWTLAYLFPLFSNVVYGFMPLKLTMIGGAWGLGEVLIASLIVSGIYREG
jgi:hypothetical protein